MNCCDEYGECRQGRDCPVRAAKVAKIGRKEHGREPLRGSPWRIYLQHLAKWMLAFVTVTMGTALVLVTIQASRGVHTYNCDLAEISPDFPKEIKQECRRLFKDAA